MVVVTNCYDRIMNGLYAIINVRNRLLFAQFIIHYPLPRHWGRRRLACGQGASLVDKYLATPRPANRVPRKQRTVGETLRGEAMHGGLRGRRMALFGAF